MTARTGRAAVVTSLACAAFGLVGCAQADDLSACAEMVSVIAEGAQAVSDAAADPATAGDELREFAEDLRAAADQASGPIGSAADALATLYEDTADRLEAGESPDLAALETAARALGDACV